MGTLMCSTAPELLEPADIAGTVMLDPHMAAALPVMVVGCACGDLLVVVVM